MNRISTMLKKEASELHPRLMLAQLLMAPLPPFVAGWLRTRLLRMAGFRTGPHTVFWGTPTIVGSGDVYRRLVIGSNCWIGVQAYFDLADCITLGAGSVLGPQVMLITGTHEIGPSHMRVGKLIPKPICTGAGVWLGARSTILPGVTIGSGAVVAAGSVVTKDVLPNTLVAGVPAVMKRELP